MILGSNQGAKAQKEGGFGGFFHMLNSQMLKPRHKNLSIWSNWPEIKGSRGSTRLKNL